ncbi:MAG: penicillin-binding protein 2 [Corynebacterium glucuronolyticum]|nr:penicillin-binding protein 2 [Corynebacterium glucuronolyticum]MDD7587453.1 penicillin-binding protein 2 [Mycobacteriaceae bacterium]MDY5834418.1 penicillin-binding protein 2 [Corynebacterium glucuronolyticum]
MLTSRVKIVNIIAAVLAITLIGRLTLVQVVWGPKLALQAEEQRTRTYVDPARRGSVVDQTGKELAYTMQASTLTVSPNILRKELPIYMRGQLLESGFYEQYTNDQLDELAVQKATERIDEMAREIPVMVRESAANADDIKEEDIRKKLLADSNYEVLVRNVDPDVAAKVRETYFGIAADHQDIRQYPNGAIGANVVGKVDTDGTGQFGLEVSQDNQLAGKDGKKTQDVAASGEAIPGTLRDVTPVTDGADISLTIDLDLQTYVQSQVQQAKDMSNSKGAEAVVLDAKTGRVLAMANSDTIDPTGDIEKQLKKDRTFGNTTISNPFEPGSVAKIITAAAAIEEGVTQPDTVHTVPGAINMAGVTVRDAWEHGDVNYTTTGIFSKSSNVGTLMLAQMVGEEKYAEYLDKFGIGQATGIELPQESAGLLPAREQWSGGTFANLPIGQGMSWTLLQMASVYQAIANGGERIEPRIIDHVTAADGTPIEQPEPAHTKVVSKHTAATLLDMFQGVTQSDPTGINRGTAPDAAIAGYQVSGKTGTAQQVDPVTHAYSNSDYWITFAGIAPANDPRFVIALMLDDPERGVHGGGGQTAAPLFKDIASWLIERDNVNPVPPGEPHVLQVP